MTTTVIDNESDILDSRDIIARIDDLQGMEPEERDEFEAEELAELLSVQQQAEGYASDWEYGEPLIRDSYFRDYAQDLAEDIGALAPDATWPNNYIDWDAASAALQQDYKSVDFGGVTYWVRRS